MLPETPVVRDRLMGFLVQPGCKHQSAAREARSQCPKHMVIKAIDIQEWIFATCNVPIWITRLRPIACRREHIVVLQRQPCVRGNPLDPWLEFVVFLFRNGPAISVLTEQSTELWQLAASDIVFQVLEVDFIESNKEQRRGPRRGRAYRQVQISSSFNLKFYDCCVQARLEIISQLMCIQLKNGGDNVALIKKPLHQFSAIRPHTRARFSTLNQ